jgi:hypothetical protein
MGLVQNVGSNTQSILTFKPSAKFASGARTIIRMNNQLVGFAFGITWNVSTIADEIYTIDDPMPHEIAPNKISVSGTLSAFHIPGYGASVKFLQANVLSFLFQKYICIEARDSATDWLLLYVPQAMVVNRSENVQSESLNTFTLSWKAIGWQDEYEPNGYPKNYNKTAAEAAPLIKI